jgi:hypothetical protein
MAVNDTRSMNGDFHQGMCDSSYIQLAPGRGGIVESPPIERLSWPTYGQAEKHCESPMLEADVVRSFRPKEVKTTYGGDRRY